MSASHAGAGDFPQLTWDLLDEPAVTEFSGRSSWANWSNVQWTATQFWDAQRSSSVDDAWKRQATGHHLVVTAGNFKRQTPISLPDLPDAPNAAHVAGDHMSFTIEAEDESKTVERDNPESWKHLTYVTGTGGATDNAG